jgi:hypothetical protein
MSIWGIFIFIWGLSILYLGAAAIYNSKKEIDNEIETALEGGGVFDLISFIQETFCGQTDSKIPSLLLFCISISFYLVLCIFPIDLQISKSIAICLLIANGIFQYFFIRGHLRAKDIYLSQQKKPWWFTKAEFIRNGHAPRTLLIILIPLSIILHLIIITRIII